MDFNEIFEEQLDFSGDPDDDPDPEIF